MSDRELVARSVAIERITEARSTALADVATVSVELDALAGRVLAENVHAPRDVPPHDYATMDGYAAAAADEPPLDVVDEIAPEDEPPDIGSGTAVRIATGAPLPSRADAVLKRENATVADGQLTTWDLAAGTNVHRRGTTAEADERLFAAGDRLAPRHAALLRDVGIDTLPVRERFAVGIVATGTEIYEGRQPDRDSAFLANLVRSWGHIPTDPRTVPDDPAAVRETIEDATANHDVVLTTGGTSVGIADHVSSVLADHDPLFAGVRLRPGRPVTAAVVDGTPVVALPGKPIAAHIAAVLVARPLFTGKTDLSTVTATPEHHVGMPDADREYAVPVVVADGRATALGHVDSSLPLYEDQFKPGLVAASTRATLADGFVLTETAIEPDESVDVVPYPAVE
ncbi:molybdopterin molybdotransferase MoeA [Halococcus saccharolyticus]|uniref:Molybdenum cofactor synthesis domain-containing protein n=1 Tax=Halococcus saccharolyticus DSM 5350 TaxID=1227455 RepID=M0MP69_9EURY|nr:molybdopterin molybdotransferase MoeA [Halococcus saccharolyticus]EMA47451.1 molybdenum cofactor synthesis domain-containing protein [Halococcus saccharolyticus DSM 5350]